MSAPTIYQALRAKLGREPTNDELRNDVNRIIRPHYSETCRRCGVDQPFVLNGRDCRRCRDEENDAAYARGETVGQRGVW